MAEVYLLLGECMVAVSDYLKKLMMQPLSQRAVLASQLDDFLSNYAAPE